ncbi:MAG: Cof-type HAD-IIB family hydrolase [Lachnospiraceae bacterium]|nr:Cof-type HAD-IIB family hydrolase [Lachnospiraceae bacterium]
MSDKKILFFDIDGTIWDYTNYIPESTALAIKRLKENGHKTFICTGRSKSYVTNPKLYSLGFDGMISGCGTLIEYENKDIFYYALDNDLVSRTLQTIRRYGFKPILEGRYYNYMDREDFAGSMYADKLTREMGELLQPIGRHWGKWEISKLSCDSDGAMMNECMEALKGDFDFIKHTSTVVEMVPKGFNKGTGVKKVCSLLGFDTADSFAFGDGENDIEMMEAAGISVAMGNGNDHIKSLADYVTADLRDDGIYKACEHFGLI